MSIPSKHHCLTTSFKTENLLNAVNNQCSPMYSNDMTQLFFLVHHILLLHTIYHP